MLISEHKGQHTGSVVVGFYIDSHDRRYFISPIPVQVVNKVKTVCNCVLEMCNRLQLKNNTKRLNGESIYISFQMIDTSNRMSG